jgi:hypothetical protein
MEGNLLKQQYLALLLKIGSEASDAYIIIPLVATVGLNYCIYAAHAITIFHVLVTE